MLPRGIAGVPQKVNSSLIDLRDLLDLLRRHPLPAPFQLALYSEQQGREGLADAVFSLCPAGTEQQSCDRHCLQQWEDLISLALLGNRPHVYRCRHGHLGFALPLPGGNTPPDCLLGGGLREKRPMTDDAFLPDAGVAVFEASLPVPDASEEEVRRAAEEIFCQLPALLEQKLHDLSLARITERLAATREIARELGRVSTAGEAIALVSEALVVLFDLPRVMILLRRSGEPPTLPTVLGLDPDGFRISEEHLAELLDEEAAEPVLLSGSSLTALLPGIPCRSGIFLALRENRRGIGLLGIFDIDLHLRDQALIELLVDHLAMRLQALRQEEDQRLERHFSTRLVSMIGTLALAGSRDELYRGLLEMSVELAGAASGSLMLFDEESQTLKIAVAKGMSLPLARTMSIPLGEGIAGRVARSGFPLLVNDIERDLRVKSRNRPRFRTKSFISIPLKRDEQLVGVLNMADKEDGGSFTEANLRLVQSFAGQAVMMIDRTARLERTGQLEELSVTDPLTGLYNRRFLEARLEEERSRSQRQGLAFCLILADLDNFKIYNDICGHLAGDKALRKAAALMRGTAREMDLVVRYGGEEFCLILPATSKRESLLVAERLRRAIETDIFPGETNLPLGRLTISLGVAAFPEDGASANDLIHAADLALYRAKALGRNRTVLYDPGLTRTAADRPALTEGR